MRTIEPSNYKTIIRLFDRAVGNFRGSEEINFRFCIHSRTRTIVVSSFHKLQIGQQKLID